MSIRIRFLILFIVITVIPLTFKSSINLLHMRGVLGKSVLNALYVVAEYKEAEVFSFLDKLRMRGADFASDGFIRESLKKIQESPPGSPDVVDALNHHLRQRKQILSRDILFIDVLSLEGKIISSTNPERVGMDKSRQAYFVNGLERSYIKDAHPEPGGIIEIDISFPIMALDDSGRSIGVLVNHYDISGLTKIMSGEFVSRLGAKTQIGGLGKTGETYLVNQDKLMITDSLYAAGAPFHSKVDTYPVRKCLEEDKEVAGTWRDYRGVQVVGASMCISVDDFRWTLVSVQDTREAFAPMRGVMAFSWGMTGLISLMVGIIAMATAKLVSDPIKALHKGTEIVGEGNLDYKVGTGAPDEIGQLSRAFDRMTGNLKNIMASRDSLEEEVRRRKETEERLRRSEEKYRNLVDNALVGVFSVTTDGEILFLNEAMARMMEFDSPEEMKKAGAIARYQNPQDRQVFIAELKKSGKIDDYELKVLTKHNNSKNILVSAVLEGEKMYSGMAIDITERQQAKVELARSNEELAQFAYVASHDLQEPLRMVTSYVRLLEKRYKGRLDKDADDFIHFATDGAVRMQRLIDDLLTYSRVGTRGKPLEAADSEKALEEALRNLEVAVKDKGAVITHDPLPKVMADETQLVQLFQNLIGNAVKFCEQTPPRVHVAAGKEGREWAFLVRDNGIGIDMRFEEKIFQVFQRLHPKDKYPGSGIGLAVCRKIVERHGGRMRLESHPGQGSTFFFTLKAVPDQAKT